MNYEKTLRKFYENITSKKEENLDKIKEELLKGIWSSRAADNSVIDEMQEEFFRKIIDREGTFLSPLYDSLKNNDIIVLKPNPNKENLDKINGYIKLLDDEYELSKKFNDIGLCCDGDICKYIITDSDYRKDYLLSIDNYASSMQGYKFNIQFHLASNKEEIEKNPHKIYYYDVKLEEIRNDDFEKLCKKYFKF